MKTLVKLFSFIPVLLIVCLPSSTLEEGIYTKSVGTISTLTLMGLAVVYLLDYSKVKEDGRQVAIWYGIIITLGLAIASIF